MNTGPKPVPVVLVVIITVFLLVSETPTPVKAQTKKAPKITALNYLPVNHKAVGQSVSVYINKEFSGKGVQALTSTRKISGKYVGCDTLPIGQYHLIDSLCRTSFIMNTKLPEPGDSIIVFYGNPVLNKKMVYEGFCVDGSATSDLYKIPVTLIGLPIFIEDINYIRFHDSLRIDRIQLYRLLQENILPVNTDFSIQSRKSGLYHVPFNSINPQSTGSSSNKTAKIVAIAGGITIGAIIVYVLATMGNTAENTSENAENCTSSCWDSFNIDWSEGCFSGPWEWHLPLKK